MKKIIKTWLLIAVVLLLTSSSSAISFLGTSVDEATLPAQMLQLTELAATAKSMVAQVKQQVKTALSQTGIREVMAFKREMEDLHSFLQKYSLDFMDLTDDIINNPKSLVGKHAKRLFDEYMLFNDCNYDYMNSDQKRICKSKMIRNVQEIATYQETTKSIKKIAQKLKDLSGLRSKSKDIKQSSDISNSIQMQIAQLQLIKTQLDMMESQNKSRERVEQRQTEQTQAEKRENSSAFIHQQF